MMGTLLHDLRYGLRMLAKSPGFTAVAVLTLALGIGANTAIFTLVNALILRMLPVHDPQALVLFGPGDDSGNSVGFPDDELHLFSYPMYREWQQKNHVFAGVAAFQSFTVSLHGRVESTGNLEPMEVQLVSGAYFSVLGVNPAVGRLFTDADDRILGGHPMAVISYDWWTGRFSCDPSIVGKALAVRGTVYTILGVTPPGFFGTTVGHEPDMWIPLQMHDLVLDSPHKITDKLYRSLDIIARLKPGVTRGQANANVNVLLRDTLRAYAGAQPTQQHLADIQKAHITIYSAATGISFLRDEFSEPLLMLVVIVGLVLLIACANIANLLLARGATRQREIAVRMALGAGRARLIRQLLTESVALGVVGGALGLLFASWAEPLLLRAVIAGPHLVDTVKALDLAPDARVLGFTLAVSLSTAILFGILPALRATRVELSPSLKEGRGIGSVPSRSRLGRALIVSQVAVSLVLLAGAGLFVRSLANLAKVNTGFNKQNVLLLKLDPSATGYSDEPHLGNLYQQVEDRVAALPEVRAASFSIVTFNEGGWNDDAWPEGRPDKSFDHTAWYNVVGPGYFATMGLPILSGRGIDRRDTANSPRVAVINETFARRFFPDGLPVGKHFGMDTPEHSHEIEVIGVVRDAKYLRLDEKPTAMAYYPYTQYIPDWGTGLYLRDFEVRFSGAPQTVVSEIHRAIGEVNDDLPVSEVITLAEQVDDSITYPRIVAQLSAFFGLLAVFLACIGIYGLMTYAVARRTNEIGIRMALGASQRDVMAMVLRETLTMVVFGLAIGVPMALVSGRWAASLLFGLKPTDPATLLFAAVVLLAVASFAGYLPARRATQVDPMVALRYE